MINITIYKKDNKINRYKVLGHANYDEYGKDIVCAAVSVLTQSTLLSLSKVAELESKYLDYKIDDEVGLIDVRLKNEIEEECFKKAQTILESLVVGLDSIKENYPEYVTLKYREV